MIDDRTIHTDTDAELDESVTGLGVLFYGDFPGDPLRMWTGNYPLSFGGETWHGVGDLVSATEVSESLDGASSGMSVTLTGLEHSQYAVESLGDYQGRDAAVYLAIIDPELGEVVGDPVLLFSGLMDSDETVDDGEGVAVTIDIERRDADHLRPRPLRYTYEDQRMIQGNGDDLGLTFVTSVQNNRLLWGVGI